MDFLTLPQIFASTMYAVPDYQRDYEWTSVHNTTLLDDVFSLLDSTNAITNSDLSHDTLKNTGKIIKTFASLDTEIRDEAIKIIGDFVKIVLKETTIFNIQFKEKLKQILDNLQKITK